MTDRASLSLRWARALALGVVALLAGIGAHVSADGLLPGPVGLAVLGTACTVLAACFLGRQVSAGRLVLLLIAGQGFVHTGLAALAGHRGDPLVTHATPVLRPAVPVERTGSYFDQWAASNPAAHSGAGPAVPAWLVHSVHDIASQPLMAALHVLAAAVVGLWLAVGERALWAVLTLTAGVVTGLVLALSATPGGDRLPVAPRLPALRPTAWPAERRPRPNIRATPVRRGPPLLLTAA